MNIDLLTKFIQEINESGEHFVSVKYHIKRKDDTIDSMGYDTFHGALINSDSNMADIVAIIQGI